MNVCKNPSNYNRERGLIIDIDGCEGNTERKRREKLFFG